MGKRRYEHSVNVSASAVELSRLYGEDPNKAELAGILHDCCKEIPVGEMLQIISDSGIILDVAQQNSSKLWHAVAGSCYVKNVLNITDEDIINSIRYHTTGRAGMSLLEKIIFTADFISAERSYDGVDIMREKAHNSLEEAMLFGLRFTIADLTRRGLPIHTDAVDCYNEIIADFGKKGLL